MAGSEGCLGEGLAQGVCRCGWLRGVFGGGAGSEGMIVGMAGSEEKEWLRPVSVMETTATALGPTISKVSLANNRC